MNLFYCQAIAFTSLIKRDVQRSPGEKLGVAPKVGSLLVLADVSTASQSDDACDCQALTADLRVSSAARDHPKADPQIRLHTLAPSPQATIQTRRVDFEHQVEHLGDPHAPSFPVRLTVTRAMGLSVADHQLDLVLAARQMGEWHHDDDRPCASLVTYHGPASQCTPRQSCSHSILTLRVSSERGMC